MRISSKLLAAAAISLIFFAAGSARAIQPEVVIQPATATTDMGFGTFGNLANIINESGLSAGYTSGVTFFDNYVASGPTHFSGSSTSIWDSDSGKTTGHIDFNLGSAFLVSGLALWNRGGNGPQNIIGFTLSIADDAAFTSPTVLGSFSANPNTGGINSVLPEVFSFTATTGQFVRMQITSNNGGTNDILGEVAFRGSPVPEPTTLGLLALGGMVGLLLRRKLS